MRILAFFLITSSLSFAQKTDQSDSLKTLSEVVVKSTRAGEKSGMAFTTIFKKDIEKTNFGQDLPYLLAQLPSVVTSSDGGTGIGYTGIRIRGSDPTRINVSLNGIPYNDSESQGVYWVDMPDFGSSAQSIQIQRGVGTSSNGAGAFGGSINVNTMGLSNESFAESNISVGSFNTMKTNLMFSTGLSKKGFVLDGRLSRIVSDGFIDRAASNLKSFYTSAAYYSNDSFLRLNVFSGHENTYQAWYGIPEALAKGNIEGVKQFGINNNLDENYVNNMISRGQKFNFYDYKNQVDDYTQTHYQLVSSIKINKNLRFNPTIYISKGKGFYEEYKSNATLSDYNIISDNLFKSDLIRRKWLDNLLSGVVWSLDYEKEKLNLVLGGGQSMYSGKHFGEVIKVEKLVNYKNQNHYYDNLGKKQDLNIYAKSTIELSPKIHGFVDLQLRIVKHDINGALDDGEIIFQYFKKSFFNPKVGISYQISKNGLLFSSFAVGNKEPSRQDFSNNIGVYMKSEHLQDLEIGYKLNLKRLSLELDFYNMFYKNQLVLTGALNDVGNAIRMNVPESYRRGIEIIAGGNINEKLKIEGNITLSKNKILNFTETIPVYSGDRVSHQITYSKTDIAFSPNLISGMSFSYFPSKNAEITLLPKYVGQQFLDNTTSSQRKIDAYFVNNLKLGYKLKPKFVKEIDINILINNILNTTYESNGATYSSYDNQRFFDNYLFPQANINYLLALKIRL